MRRWGSLALLALVMAGTLLLGGCTLLVEVFDTALGQAVREEQALPAESTAQPPATPAPTLQPTPVPVSTPVPAPALVAVEPGEVAIIAATHSSSFFDSFDGVNAVDNDEDTCWITQEGDMAGAWLKLTFAQRVAVNDFLLVNGIIAEEDESEFSWDWYGRVAAMELVFDGDESDTLVVDVADGQYFSEPFITREAQTIEIRILDVYPGVDYANLAVSELTFWYDPDSWFIQALGDEAVPPTATPRIKPTPAPPAADSAAQGAIADKTGYAGPRWWSWTQGDGEGGWGFEETDLRAGKWLSQDGEICLYIDYDSSPDGFSYGISYYGAVDEYYAQIPDTRKSYAKAMDGHGYKFTVEKTGEMILEKSGEKHTLHLMRSKYTQNDG